MRRRCVWWTLRCTGLVLISAFPNNIHSLPMTAYEWACVHVCVCCASGWRWLWQLIAITVAFHCLLFSLCRLILRLNIWNLCVSGAIAVKWLCLQRALKGGFVSSTWEKWPVTCDFGNNIKRSSNGKMKAAAALKHLHTSSDINRHSKQGDEV